MAVYLATTALREFWPHHEPLTLLGRWCLPEDGPSPDLAGPYTIAPFPWDDPDRFDEAAKYVESLYERWLFRLCDALNEVHGMSKPVSYWRVVVGGWFRWYLDSLYDRYICLCTILDAGQAVVTVGLARESFTTALTAEQFTSLCVSDAYALQQYTSILETLGVSMCRRPLPPSSAPRRVKRKSVRQIATGLAKHALEVAERRAARSAHVLIVSGGGTRSDEWRLAITSGFKVVPGRELFRTPDIAATICGVTRSRLRQLLRAEHAFDRIVGHCLADEIPVALVEGFQTIRQRLRHPPVPKVLLSATGWYSSDAMRVFAAEAQERGCRLLTAQHGGYYGMLEFTPLELHEQRIGACFYSWGWQNRPDRREVVKPMPALPLRVCRRVKRHRRRLGPGQKILLVSTMHPRYLYRFQSHPVGSQWSDYIDWQLRLARALLPAVRTRLVVRPYFETYGWPVFERWRQAFPDTVFDKSRTNVASLASARLTIVDHPSTTLLEVMASNIPTVCYWDPRRFRLRSSAAPYFDTLRAVGILHDDPETAAAIVNDVANAPEDWWESASVQSVRQQFCERFARTAEDCLEQWNTELLAQAGRPQREIGELSDEEGQRAPQLGRAV